MLSETQLSSEEKKRQRPPPAKTCAVVHVPAMELGHKRLWRGFLTTRIHHTQDRKDPYITFNCSRAKDEPSCCKFSIICSTVLAENQLQKRKHMISPNLQAISSFQNRNESKHRLSPNSISIMKKFSKLFYRMMK